MVLDDLGYVQQSSEEAEVLISEGVFDKHR
jgi:hypothetical protein